MRRWALVDKDTKYVHGIALWDGVSLWEPHIPNVDLIECENTDAEPGGKYIDGTFLPPEKPTITPDNEVTSEPTVI